jgi:hypothetical protein
MLDRALAQGSDSFVYADDEDGAFKLCYKDRLRHAYYTISNKGKLLILCPALQWDGFTSSSGGRGAKVSYVWQCSPLHLE